MRRIAMACLLVVLGCGGSDDPPIDDPGPPEPGPATITLTNFNQPGEGITVVFHNPDGSIIATEQTDANGTASAVVPPDAMMTVLQPQPPAGVPIPNYLYTIVGVQPNDTFTTGFFDFTLPTVYQDISVTMPGLFEGATEYRVRWGCGSSSSADPNFNPVISTNSNCANNAGKITLFAEARDGSGNRLAHSFLDYTPVVATTLGAPPAAVLPAWQTAVTNATLSRDDTPPGSTGALAEAWLSHKGQTFIYQSLGTSPTILAQPNGFFDLATLIGVADFGSDISIFQENTAAPFTTQTVHLEERLAGRIPGMTITNTNPARPELEVFSTMDAANLDVATFCFTYGDLGQPASNAWQFLAPPGTTKLVVPELPAELASLTPNEDTFYQFQVATASGFSNVEGYDEIRKAARFDVASFDYYGNHELGQSVFAQFFTGGGVFATLGSPGTAYCMSAEI